MSRLLKTGAVVPARLQSENVRSADPAAGATPVGRVEGTSNNLPIAAYPPGVDEYLRVLASKDGLRRLHRSVLRTGSIDARELLTAHATQRALTWSGLRHALLRYCAQGVLDPQIDVILAKVPALPLMTLARVVALQNLRPNDRRVAFALYGRVLAHHGARAFRKPHGKLLLDLAFQFLDRNLIHRGLREFKLEPLEKAALTADLLNPARAPGSDEAAWLGAVNSLIAGDGTATLSLLSEEGKAFDRLDTLPVAYVNSGPKVTVALTTWCPDEGLITAFRSISNQTWRNLEILVMDDASPPEYLDLLKSVVSTDARARLIRMPRNGGTYVARNRALDEATGEFFTVHDSDDWAHPERIERQVRRLMSVPGLVSCASRALRADSDLIFNLPGVSPSRENASSLMFSRKKVMDAIGYYDRSRKGADTEYALRILEHFGSDSHVTLEEHLALIRLTAGSLSRDEFKPGWRHPSRMTYRLGYQWHHARCRAEGRSLYVGKDGAESQFTRPLRFLVERDSDEVHRRRHWDVLYVLDVRATAEQPPSFLDELLELVRANRRVAIMHMESLLFPLIAEVEPYVPELQRLISTGVVGEVLFSDQAHVDTVVIRDPSSLQFAASTRTTVTANRVLILPEGAPRSSGASGWTYSIAEVEEHVFRVFEQEPTWVMNKTQFQACCTPLNTPRKAIPRTWGGVSGSVARWRAPRPAPDGSPLRVGRIILGQDDVAYIRENLLNLGPPSIESVGVVGTPAVKDQLRIICEERGWIMDTAAHPEDIFYAKIDVLLLHGADPNNPDHLTHAREAAASGCILLGDNAWSETLGKELCCAEDDLVDVCTELRSSREMHYRYRAASEKWREKTRDVDTFVRVISPVCNVSA